MDKHNHIDVSFEIFFDGYYAAATRYCFTIVMDKDDAEDIVQQVFVAMWQSQQEGVVYSNPRAYLYRAVYNAGLNFLKHERVKKLHARKMILMQPGYIDPRDNEGTELQKKIDQAIAALPQQCGRIFKMNRFENLKYREIASRLSLSEKTIENQMGKALKLLKEALRDHLPLFWILMHIMS